MKGTTYIYVIESDNGSVKIGFSKNPEKRVKSLQTGHDTKLKVVYKHEVPCDRARMVESYIHRENNYRRMKGEWFNMSVDDAIAEIKIVMMKYGENNIISHYL